MKIIDFFKKNRIYFLSLFRILRSTYTLVFIIPLLFNIISYNYTKNFVDQTSVSINETVLKNSQTFFDAILNNTISSVFKLSSNKTISEIAYWDASSLPQQYDLTYYNSIWENYSADNSYINQKYIYYPKTDSIYTGSTLTISHFHYMFAYSGETIMEESIWKEQVLNKQSSGLISIPSSDGTKVFFTYATYDPALKDVLSNIIVELNFDQLVSDTLGKNNDQFFMYASDGTVIGTGLTEKQNKAIKELYNDHQYGESRFVSSDNYEIFTTKSQISNWNYGYIANNQYIEQNMFFLKSIIFAACLLCTLVSLIIIGKREKTAQEIADILPDEYPDNKNTYLKIKNSLAKLIGENKDYTSRLSSQSNILKEQLIINLLSGKKTVKELSEEQAYLLNIDSPDTFYTTVVLCAKNPSQIFNDESYLASDSEKIELSKIIIANIIKETLAQYYNVELVSMNNLSVAVINYNKSQSESFNSDITFILETSMEIILNEFNFDVISAISNQHPSLNTISNAYNESLLCMEYAISSNKQIMFYGEMETDNQKSFPIEIEDDIIECLKNKNYRQCKKTIENAIYRFQQNKDVSTVVVRSFAYELLTIFFRNAIPDTNDTLGMFMTEVDTNSIMSETATSSEIMLRTITIIERYLDKYDTLDDNNDTTGKSDFYLQIKNYINEHYYNPDLSVLELATIFKINSSYLSSQFKKEYNVGLLDYITSVRIEAAKKLLLTTDESNVEISRRVGYSNVRTFLRVFSKYEGVTPKEYRRINNPSA